MHRVSRILLVMTVALSAAVGCGDDDKDSGGDSAKCDEAAKILMDCDQDVDDVKECGRAEQAIASCVVKYPKGACSDDFASKDSQDFFNCLSQ